ncbi:hypothetical protein [Arthrobacter sp. OY3WO11]|uniref:hypothetical protein n=1 Tax=Arthrobacter sp. OY3WO11 TaxID=1835723 RepID=UPI0007CF9624|nr:hypothetical protein [Arthrobacter sp. OY3WO11]OAD97623.1 hypothetical protein A6A22_19595 [Arthrobacter sp. OY3WO11]
MIAGVQVEDRIEVAVENRHEMDVQLESNVALLVDRAALPGDRGILITRNSIHEFTLSLSLDVPYGEIREIDRR